MPNATAGAIIYRKVNDNFEILLTRRNIEPFKDYWCLPGGHIDEYEKAENAIIREVKEETNLDFKPHFLCYLDEIYIDNKVHNVVIIYYGTASNIIKADPGEVSDIKWFNIQEALNMTLAFEHNKALQIFKNQTNNI